MIDQTLTVSTPGQLATRDARRALLTFSSIRAMLYLTHEAANPCQAAASLSFFAGFCAPAAPLRGRIQL